MPTWIIHLANLLIAEPPVVENQPVNRIEISSFDCEKVQDEKSTGGPIQRGNGISGWRNGGPSGATWNIIKLRCVAELSTPCVDGNALIELRIGSRLVRSAKVRFEPNQPLRLTEFKLKERDWKRWLDSPQKAEYPYKVGIFRAIAYITQCRDPKEPAAMYPYAEKSFTVGFAYGE